VSGHGHDHKGIPDWVKPIEVHHRGHKANDAKNTPARAGDDAMGFAAPSKVRKAIYATRPKQHHPREGLGG